MKIIVDAFGGDNAPLEILKGCSLAVAEYGCDIILTGNKDIIKKVASENSISLNNMEIEHTEGVISFCDEPTSLLKENRDTSLGKAFDLISNGVGDAVVTAGNTGAAVVGSTLIVKRIKGIKRPALGVLIPSQNGCYMLIDCGANSDCRADMLEQFAIMGSAYMKEIVGIDNPKVGLVNIGEEETKGTELQIEAFSLLSKAKVNFVGNIEPRYIPRGDCDVVVCDGFTGNVILKLSEGLVKLFSTTLKSMFKKNILTKLSALFLSSGIKQFKKSFDYSELGGAPILGAKSPIIKAHGSSNAKAIKNAIRQAIEFVNADVISKIEASMNASKEEAI